MYDDGALLFGILPYVVVLLLIIIMIVVHSYGKRHRWTVLAVICCLLCMGIAGVMTGLLLDIRAHNSSYYDSPRYEKAEDYISEMRRLGLVYDAYTYNCGWIAIRALYQGEWGKKREKLYNMLWYVNWKENLEYMRTVIPQKAFPRLARIYKKKRRHL